MVWPRLITVTVLTLALGAPGQAQTAAPKSFGRLSGTVVNHVGVPQMGASVSVARQGGAADETVQLFSGERGTFLASRLLPGLYTIRVTLAGFLPSFERNVRIEPNLTTILKIEMGSIFASMDTLRRRPNQEKPDADEWAWVLRTSSSSRAILRYSEGEAVVAGNLTAAERGAAKRPHARLELTAGARRPGSVSNISDAPSTAIAYDQKIGAAGRVTFAGQASYERAAAAGFAASWLPSGEVGRGPETTLVLRQSTLGPGRTPFRGVRMEHNNRASIGGVIVDFGAEYILASVGRSTSSIRPNVQAAYEFSPGWKATLSLASRPWAHSHGQPNALRSILEELDAFPTILMRDSRPIIEGGWHEELAIERQLSQNVSLSAGVFRDGSNHTAIFGRGSMPEANYIQDFCSNAFAYDGGASGSLGSRVAYRQKLPDGIEVVVLYAWAGALVPVESSNSLRLRDILETRKQHSVAARVSTRLPKARTQLAASYKWLSGPAVSRQDAFGEVSYQVDPFLNLSVRQPLPTLFNTRIEALADFRNLLAQGYVPIDTADGRVLLIPAFRSFRGGVNFQF